MKKIIYLIIGIVSIALSYNVAYADDCYESLYENVYTCKAKGISSYCTLEAKLTGSQNSPMDLYQSTYCDIIRDSDDAIFKIIAEQFKAEDPKMDKDKVKKILTERMDPAYSRVKTAYEREKIMYQTRQSLMQKFQASEMWYNGDITDSPFDLILDLNLIEIVLFGGQAEWVDDVWKWPKGSDDKKTAETGTAAGETPTGTTPTVEEGGTKEPKTPTAESPIDQFECVPDDNLGGLLGGGKPDASGTKPPGVIPPSCGNNKLDSGETCDDGNNKAGDGCSESCETEAGANLSCKDNEAVTFKQLSQTADKKTGGQTTTGKSGDTTGKTPEPPPLNCPPGSTATKKPTTQAEKEAKVKQDPNYPGPFIGGVLKNYPPSEQTDCPPGETYVEASAAGQYGGTCISTSFCSDFEPIRTKLFGADYKKDPAKEAAAAALEVSVCVNVKKVKRPESPYPLNQGCIDCNILAMNDIMSKLLDKNVNPLQNSMQSWGSSNRWGPTVSFNLNVLVKRAVNAISSPKYAKDFIGTEKPEKAVVQSQQQASNNIDPNKTSDVPQTTEEKDVTKRLEDLWQDTQKKNEAQKEFLKNYRMTGDASADQLAYGGIIAKLRELQASFQKIQEKYVDLALATKFQEKAKCSF